MPRVVALSNRVFPPEEKVVAGGLAVCLRAALEGCGGLWFGWSGRVDDRANDAVRFQSDNVLTYASLDLTQREYDLYYTGFSNRTLWPLHHGRVDLMRFDPVAFDCYRSVNARFARNLWGLLDSDDLVWVHDFHLIFVGAELRRLGVSSPLGFFLHVPFPFPDLFTVLPCHREIAEAMAAYDLVGFQTENDVHNFRDLLVRRFGGTAGPDGTMFAFGRTFKIAAFPIGIDASLFATLAQAQLLGRAEQAFNKCFGDRLGIIGVDRLDYTKGISNRLLAYERLLEQEPVFRRQTFLLQIAAPTRESVSEYATLKAGLEALTGRINARYAEIDWTPVHYINRIVSQDRLAALFRRSRVALVTPVADGMNLIAKEYVAAQAPDDPGVLVLSRFAGAARRLTDALIVNPYDIDGTADALRRALQMPRAERRSRWKRLMREIDGHDVHDWRSRFLAALEAAPPHSDVVAPDVVTHAERSEAVRPEPAGLRLR